MSQIRVDHLTFYYQGSPQNIFDDVSFQIDTNWRLGFIGRNGKGKTTFLKLLKAGSNGEGGLKNENFAYGGNITCPEKVDYFPFFVECPERNTIDIVEEMYPDYEFWKLCRELSLLQMDADILYRPFFTLSGGEQTKVMLAVLFSMEENFLLIDEPTNHLDKEARESVREYLKGKKGFILVSHDRDFLDQCVDHILVINRTNIEVYQGNFSTWWEQKKKQDAFELSENKRLKREIERLGAAAREAGERADKVEAVKIGRVCDKTIASRAYIGEKSRKTQMRRKTLEKRKSREIEEKSKLLKNLEAVEDLKLFPLRHPKERLVELKDVQIFYGEKRLKKVSFSIENGDCVALQGRNGCGKSSIIKAILQEAGTEMKWTGELEKASGLVISYVPQKSGFLKGNLVSYAENRGLEIPVFLALLRKLDFEREQFEKDMEHYSEGQKKKVLIAASFCEKAHLYIWDEPLNYIDIFSRMQIEALLRTYRPTLLMVEHDRAFVEKICNKKISCE